MKLAVSKVASRQEKQAFISAHWNTKLRYSNLYVTQTTQQKGN